MTNVRLLRARCIAGIASAAAIAAGMIACAANTSQFASALDAHRWSDAASAINADTSLLDNESNLFQAAMLYSFPDRPTYDPIRARELFERLLQKYPTTHMHQAAVDQLSMLYELQRASNTSDAKRQELQSRIAELAADTLQLRRSIDSIAVRLRAEQDQSALLRKITSRLESDLADRESQLGVLHTELNHLKQIDLQPALRSRGGDTAVKKPRKR